MSVATSELDALVRREHSNPHAVLGAHPDGDGVVVRTLRPAARAVTAIPDGHPPRRAAADPRRRRVRRHDRGRRATAPLPARRRLRRRRPVHDRGSIRVPAHDRRARPAPDLRGAPRGALRPPRGTHPRASTRHRDRVRRVGAVGAGGQRGGRLQLLGRPAARDALARLDRRVGAVPARCRRGRPLQVRDPHPGSPDPAQGGPVRAGHRGSAQDRVGRVPVPPRVVRAGRRVAAAPPATAAGAQTADLDLRGPPGIVAAEFARGQPAAHLPRAGRRAERVRQGPRLHARRAAPGHGPSVRRVVGLPGHRLLRPHPVLRLARRLPRVRRPPAPERRRRHPRLGAGPLPARRVRAGPVRRHRPLRARRPPSRASTPTGARWCSTTAATRSATS